MNMIETFVLFLAPTAPFVAVCWLVNLLYTIVVSAFTRGD